MHCEIENQGGTIISIAAGDTHGDHTERWQERGGMRAVAPSLSVALSSWSRSAVESFDGEKREIEFSLSQRAGLHRFLSCEKERRGNREPKKKHAKQWSMHSLLFVYPFSFPLANVLASLPIRSLTYCPHSL